MGDAGSSESFLIRGVTFDVDPDAKPVDFDKNVSHVAPGLGNLDRDKDGIRYYLANDETEHSRLNLQHEMLSLIIQSLYRAPIKSPKTVIDIATGTGIWATEFAKQHPDSTVIGTDINTVNNPPSVPNLSYKLHDAEKDSWETLAPVDYIHARFVVTCFDDAPKVVSSMFNSLSSGGWLEFQDICFETHDPDGSVKGTLLDKYIDMLNEAGAAVDRDIHKPKRYAEWMRQAGFVDVQEVIIPFPGNTWTKDERQKKIGELMIRNMVMGQRSLSGMLTQKWSEEELKDVKDNLVEASANPKMHSYWELYVVYGRKP